MWRPECFVLSSEWSQSIWQCTTSTGTETKSLVLIHQVKETKSAKCGLQEFVLVLDSPEESAICVMCLLWRGKVIWPAPEVPSSSETHRNTLTFWELPQIGMWEGCVVLWFVSSQVKGLSFCNFSAIWQCFFSLQWKSVSSSICKQCREGQFFLVKWVKSVLVKVVIYILVKVVYTAPTATISVGWSQVATAWLL